MANKSAILSVRIISDAKGAISGFNQTGDAAGGLGGKLSGKLGPGLLAAAGGVAAIAAGAIEAGKFLYGVGETFDEVEDTIRVGTGAIGDDLDGLVDSAKNVGTTVPAQFEDIGPVIADLNTRLGLTGPVLETVASQYLEAGRILGEDVDIQSSTAAFTAFGIEGEAVSGAMDTLFRVSQGTGVGINDLTASIQKQAPALDMLGFSFDQSAALIGTLDKAGMDADKTLAGMSKGLVTLAKDGEEPQAAFQRVTGEIEGLINKGDQAAALDLASTLFGTKGATQFVGAIKSGSLSMEALNAAAMGTGDTILGAGAATMDAAEKWDLLKNKALVALEPIGSFIFNSLGVALDWVMNLVDSVNFDAFSAGIGPLTGIGELIGGLVTAIRDYLTPIIEYLLPVVQTTISTIISLIQPIITIITGIFQTLAGLVTGDWSKMWTGIQTIGSGAINFIKNLVSGLGSALVSLISGMVTNARNAWATGWDAIVSTVKAVPGKVTGALGNMGSLLVNAGKDVVRGFINGIESMGSAIADAARNIAGKAVDGIKNFLGIKSPSRLFYSLGLNTGQGYVNGLDAMTGKAGDAALALVAPPTVPQLTGPNYQGIGAAAATIINITVQGAIDPVSTARQIEDLLRRNGRRISGVKIGA